MQTAAASPALDSAAAGGMLGLVAPDDFITTAEAAELLGVHQSRIYKFIKQGRIDAERFGPMWRVRRESLERVRERPVGYPKGRPRRSDPVD